ncbi:MAG: 23S rRNA (adenine(2503)-C(2))-methyltransferase RlmN [Clostridiales bacterium]|jgi:23S rRNA (adenine2503-C2)-methyltransferase|nr:23S rRNA (adenine(2503)-C(2))-methyltransferase RlmN [Clostridiales bacterium]
MKPCLLEYSERQISDIIVPWGQPSFRGRQILEGLFSGKDFDGMSNLPAALKQRLNAEYTGAPVGIERKFESKDGTVKYLFKLADGELIEGVLMSYKYGKTLCISTQISCRMGCAFCASGADGLKRNLTASEMLGQVVSVNRDDGGGAERAVTNVVLMGSGEPLDNYDNVSKFLERISSPDTINISERNISVSTAGIPDKIISFADDGRRFNLTVSLHAPTDKKRSEIMPVNKAFGIDKVIAAARYYFDKTGRRVIFEYSMIDGFNDFEDDAAALASLLRAMPCHVNLIRLNAVAGKSLSPSRPEAVKAFLSILQNAGISSTLRRILGSDIEGACGQLRRRYKAENLKTEEREYEK